MASTDNQSTDYHNRNLYGYTPTRWVGFIFVIVFGFSTVFHVVQGIRSRLWWLFWTIIIAGAAESVGWVARIISSYDATKFNPYLIQDMLLILAPIPLVAANFIIFGQIIRRLGQEYSRLNARWYARIFVPCDIISLMVQGGGGGIVSSNSSNPDKAKLGTDVILCGIIFQTAAISVYMVLGAEFVFRYLYKRPVRHTTTPSAYPFDRNMQQMLGALAFSSLCVYVRSWYRTFEFADGWNGRIGHTERYFVIMDGVMIALATIIMNVCHPGRLLGPKSSWSEEAIYRREKDQLNGYDRQGRPYDAYEAVRLNGSAERV